MSKQLSLLPLMHQFDKNGFITDTTYWETDACKEDPYHLVFNVDTYSLLIPDDKSDWLVEIVEAESVVITRGSYNGKNDCFELMFQDDNKPPFTIVLSDEQFSRVSPLKEGWHGRMYIFNGSLSNCENDFDKVCYRVVDTLSLPSYSPHLSIST